MSELGLNIDLTESVEKYQRAFAAYSQKAFPRAIEFALNGVAIEASKLFREEMKRTLDKPVPWIIRGVQHKKAELSGASMDTLFSDVHIQKAQSAYLKYMFGVGDNTRSPDDVGLAGKSIWIPNWMNLKSALSIKKDSHENLPRTAVAKVMSRMNEKRPGMTGAYRSHGVLSSYGRSNSKGSLLIHGRHARPDERAAYDEAKRKRRAYDKKWGVFVGKVKMHGEDVKAVIGRPPRVTWDKASAEARAKFASRYPNEMNQSRSAWMSKTWRARSAQRVVPIDAPRVLFFLVPTARYKPELQAAWTAAAEAAAATLPGRLEKELAEKAVYFADRT